MSRSYISESLRQQIVAQCHHRCAYCLTPQNYVCGSFTIDHIVPQSRGGATEIDNLCLACWLCNLRKGNRVSALDPLTNKRIRLFHPYQQIRIEHFEFQGQGALIEGLSDIGRITVQMLNLNSPIRIETRKIWIAANLWPPI